MALKILLADDSMTAQNMGKNILVDAGYEVVAVSNGAAALKKIAELKPDIAVLDIYMPGYSGLEVCERVKSSPMTAKMPVLLTVGKMEPYRPEDGAKVNADNVIIKPFEASDLIAAVGKLAEMVSVKQVSVAPKYEEPDDADDFSYQQSAEAVNASDGAGAASAFAAMMSAPAMMDEFPVDFPVNAAVPLFEEPKPVSFTGFGIEAPRAPTFELPLAEAPAFGFEEVSPVANEEPAPLQVVEAQSEVLQEEQVADAPAFDSPVSEPNLPLELESATPVIDVSSVAEVVPIQELEFTSAPQVGEIEVAPETALETPVEEELLISDLPDPVLATTPEDFAAFVTHVGELDPEPVSAGIVSGIQEMPEEARSAIDSLVVTEVGAVPNPVDEAIANNIVVAEYPQSAVEPTSNEEPTSFEEPIAAEGSAIEDEPHFFAAPAAFAEPAVADVPLVLEEAVAEPAAESGSMSDDSEAPVVEEAAEVEPAGWSAEETMVLPAESMALLEEEMRQSFTETAPVPEPLKDPFEDDILGSSEHIEEVAEVLPESTETPTEPLVAEPEAPLVATDEDREFEARLAAALNEMQSAELVATSGEMLAQDVTETADSTVADVDYVDIDATDAILQTTEDSAAAEAPKAMAASASFISEQAAASERPAASDAMRIADVVHRVFERYKEQMVAEIARELSNE